MPTSPELPSRTTQFSPLPARRCRQKWIEQQAKAAEAADAAVAKFEEGARRVGLSAESRALNATVGEGPELFGQIARRFESLNRSAEQSGKAGK
jgi:hypothetical protein